MTYKPVWLLPVDHRNMRAFYSRGLVAPRNLLDKYRSDLLQLAPSQLLFVADRISPALADGTSVERDGIPVLLEIADEHFIGPEPVPVGNSFVRLLPETVPVGWIDAIHVRSEDEAREIRARDYRNIDASMLPIRVSADLFEADSPTFEELVAVLESVDTSEGPDNANIVPRECVAGALQLLLDGLPPHPGILSQSAEVLSTLLKDGKKGPIAALTDALISVGWLIEPDDVVIFGNIAEAVVEQSGPQPPVGGELVRALQARLDMVGLSAPEAAESYLRSIGEILRGDREMVPFKQHGGLRSLKALLLFLLRSDPNATKSWFAEDVNMEDSVGALALLWTGMSARMAGVPVGQRGTSALTTLLQEWVASVGASPLLRSAETSGQVVLLPGRPLKMEAGGRVIGSWEPLGPSRRETLLADPEADSAVAVALCLALNWQDCLETVVEAENVTIGRSRSAVQVVFAGCPKVTVRVVATALQERLRGSSDAEVDAAVDSLEADPSPPPIKRARPRKPARKKEQGPEPAAPDGEGQLLIT